jgi:hypothetical protein
MMASMVLEAKCPDIPLAKFRSLSDGDHFFAIFTEWAEGEVLRSQAILIPETGEVWIPPQIVTSLAEFVFNVSTCGIEYDTRTSQI